MTCRGVLSMARRYVACLAAIGYALAGGERSLRIAAKRVVACIVAVLVFAAQAPSPAAESDDEPVPKLESSRDLLELYGVGDQQLATFTDRSDVESSEHEALLRVLQTARRFTFGDWYRWRQTKLPWSTWSEDSKTVRGDVFQLNGTCTKVTLEAVPDDLAERFDLARYWRCEFTLDEDQQPAIVYALAVPNAWSDGAKPPQPSGAKGIFIKLAGADGQAPTPVFVAARAAWYPDTELGNLGMDVGLFDTIEDRTRLQASDGDCFYELLAAVKRANQRELLARTRPTSPDAGRATVQALFNEPQDQHGRLFSLIGTTERVVEVRIDNPEAVQAIGIDRYFEMELVTSDTRGNPVTFCALELPPGMPRGETASVDVRVPGFFFKVWSYQIGKQGDKAQFQLAPMLVGREPYLLPKPQANNWFSTVVTIVVITTILVIAGALWWLNRSDRRARQRLRRLQDRFEV
jgi:hypothetical protein